MRLRLLVPIVLVVSALSVCGAQRSSSSQSPEAPGWALSRRIYRVDDLFVQRDWRMRDAEMPTLWQPPDRPRAGGGLVNTVSRGTDAPPQGLTRLAKTVRHVVNNLGHRDVAPWQHDGGPGVLTPFSYGNTAVLMVTQTAEGHKQIAALLKAIRAASDVERPAITVHAKWVEVDDGQIEVLLGKKEARRIPAELTSQALVRAGGRLLYRAATTCADGQIVFVAAGALKHYVAGSYVNMPEAIAGWEAQKERLLTGALLEVRPQLHRDARTALLDYRAYVNHATRVVERALPDLAMSKGDSQPTTATWGYPEIDFHTLRGSLRIPLDKTVLLGVTTGPDLKAGRVMCLLVKVSASK